MKHEIKRTIILFAVLSTLSPAAVGKEIRPEKRRLSLDDAMAMGLASSPALHSSLMAVEESRAARLEVSAARLPSIKLGAGYTRLSEVPPFIVTLPFSINGIDSFTVSPNYFNNYTIKASLEQPLFTGFRLESAEAAARSLEGSAAKGYDKDKAEQVFRVKSAYWTLVGAEHVLSVVEEMKRQVGEHLKDVRAFYEQGLLTRNEVLKAEVRFSDIELSEVEADNAAARARVALNSLIGLPLETGVETTTAPESVSMSVDFDRISRAAEAEGAPAETTWAEALDRNPEIGEVRFRIKAAEAGLKEARSGLLPQVYLTANYYYLDPNPRYMPSRDEFKGTWDAGISVSLDIWNWGRTRQRVSGARARLERARDAERLAEDRIELEITNSRLAIIASRAKSSTAEKTAVMAGENLRVARERFKQGVALNSEVLDAETELFQARLSETQAAVELAVALASYEKAMGR